jgi:hypothetical protein
MGAATYAVEIYDSQSEKLIAALVTKQDRAPVTHHEKLIGSSN